MRIVCVHPSRDPLPCGHGPVRFGSAPGNDIVPIGAGVDPHHASVVADARGLVLDVRPACQRVYVNARAVRARALMHYGDTLTLGSNKFLVTSDTPPPPAPDAAAIDDRTTPVSLRIVAGVASGQALAVKPELRLGAGSRHFGDLAYQCRVRQTADGVLFESDSVGPRVNGWRCNRVWLSAGDQIVLGEHRLLVEAPGLQHAAYLASLPAPPAPRAPVREPDDTVHTEVWWLIGAAVVLAVAIAFFLYFRW